MLQLKQMNMHYPSPSKTVLVVISYDAHAGFCIVCGSRIASGRRFLSGFIGDDTLVVEFVFSKV